MPDIRIGSVEDVHGRVTDIFADPSGAVRLDFGLHDRILDLGAVTDLMAYLRLAYTAAGGILP